MKTLMLMRHGQAEERADGDKARRLTAHGVAGVKDVAARLAKNHAPQAILASDAVRTMMTAQIVADVFNHTVVPVPRLYNPRHTDIVLSAIFDQPDETESLLLVGHNPCIHELVLSLAAGLNERQQALIGVGYQSGTLTALSCPVESWVDLENGKNPVLDILQP